MGYGLCAALACSGLAGIAFKWKPRLLRLGAIGLAVGYAIGVVAGFVISFLRLPFPPLQIGNAAFAPSVWLPPAFGIAAMAAGMTAAALKDSKPE